MLKMNSKKARENIRNYIIENCDTSNYDVDKEPETWKEVREFIILTFTDEKLQYDNRYNAGLISTKDLFFDWCQGLPSSLDTCYYYNRSAVDDLAQILEETDEEKSKFDESQAEEKLTYMIYSELFR